jgi:hypothetical protein
MKRTSKSQRMWITAGRFLGRTLGIALVCATAAACMAGPRSKAVNQLPADQVGRPVLPGAAETQSLQSSVMALADTSMQRIATGLGLAGPAPTPEGRRDDTSTRLILSSALVAIAMEPDPVDALADLLTHTTLTADAQRNAAKDKPAGSAEVKLLEALEQNDADAWRLAERWVNEPTRVAFRKKILAWQGPRTSAATVAFVRLSDINRGGSTSVESGEGMFDALHAATEQADQARLLAERSLFLAQRMPFLMRWQAEMYTASALATKEAQQTQAQIEQMSAVTASMSRVLAGMADQLSRERQAALDDLFVHIAAERKASLDQINQIVQQQRKLTLAETAATLDTQRKGILKDILEITNVAGRTGTTLLGRTLLVGGVLIVVLLLGLVGVLLLFRRLPPVERRVAR